MKLPIIERMETAKTGEVVPLTQRVSFTADTEKGPRAAIQDRAWVVKSEVRFVMVQHTGHSETLSHLERRAKYALMHEIYGPVLDRLYEILHGAYEEALPYDSKIVANIDQLISDLRLS